MHELVHLQSLSSISQSPFAVLNLSRLPPISASLKGKNNSYVNFNVFMFTITIIKECYFSLAPGHLPVKQGMLIFQLRYQSSEWLASQVIRLLPAVQPSNWRVTNTITQLFTGCTNQHRIVCKKPRNNITVTQIFIRTKTMCDFALSELLDGSNAEKWHKNHSTYCPQGLY